MDLEWFMEKISGKQIKIESIHTDEGLLGINILLSICDVEISKAEQWDGYCLKINDGSVTLYFSTYKISEYFSNILMLYHNEELVGSINLPDEDSWE